MDAIIIAGGKGTRLGLSDIPKPMVKINNKPLLEYQIELLICNGFKRVYILSGYLSEVIIDYFDKRDLNIEIIHVVEKIPLGTAGAIKQLEGIVKNNFLVLYGDTFVDVNLKRFIDFDSKLNSKYGSLFVHPNDHPFDSDLIKINDLHVEKFIPKPHKNNSIERNFVNAALYILSPKIFKHIKKGELVDLGRDIFPKLKPKSFSAYKSTEYIKDIGTPSRLKEVENDFLNGKTKKKNFANKQKAIFLDRDGIINKESNTYISSENFKIYKDLVPFIKNIRTTSYLIIVVTNQPVLAKGFITYNELNLIHSKLDKFLADHKLFIDDLYFCPHHPKKGFEGEIESLKIKCECRKPNIGMIKSAESHYNIDLNESWIIGDRYVDIETGKRAGLKTILINRGLKGNDKELYSNTIPDYKFNSLKESLKQILKNDNN